MGGLPFCMPCVGVSAALQPSEILWVKVAQKLFLPFCQCSVPLSALVRKYRIWESGTFNIHFETWNIRALNCACLGNRALYVLSGKLSFLKYKKTGAHSWHAVFYQGAGPESLWWGSAEPHKPRGGLCQDGAIVKVDGIYHVPLLGWLEWGWKLQIFVTPMPPESSSAQLPSTGHQNRMLTHALVGGGSVLHDRGGLLVTARGETEWSGEKHPLQSFCDASSAAKCAQGGVQPSLSFITTGNQLLIAGSRCSTQI